jgi:hypothetical protein
MDVGGALTAVQPIVWKHLIGSQERRAQDGT